MSPVHKDFVPRPVRDRRRDPKARAMFLATSNGGGLPFYLHMHDNATDMEGVLRDYGKDMILPALELYAHKLLTDTCMTHSWLAKTQR
jgi:TetR/AcrR family transcriptional regulator, regulator of cefoperazone and chloramphenicol sensitivity